ncbi:MAG: efflux RND transporter periplasmic adaptor subunit [Paludibacter sp.]|nr:efflux RND transporter periplasmic adaptor subunit [Bacteroidales bacterium]MCM1068491.1 efflux RND transporter periplasmic adaptor subunit [Prevotella sp.]MCM1353445.1 efflux RND transporter periplasmic adaptor subunit [Bacteroides sp.]MCM1442606.1 efflux RND transporter periplasmic adaptor subunit [Muribaculum sp.]MCM1481451.1 efflux RND transporter periplasmic adaptor subunit [Paludibacter sp.]
MKKALKWIIAALVAIAVVWTFIFLWKKSQPKPIVYETHTVVRGDIEKRTVVTGKVEPRDEVEIKPQISGIVSELYKEAGQTIRKGEAIAKIKVIPDMATLNSAESRVRLAKYNLENTRRVFERDSTLAAQGIVSAEEYEKSRLQYRADQEEFQAAEDNLSITRDGVAQKMDQAGYSNTLVKSTIAGTILNIPVKVGNSVILSNTFNDGTTIATVADLSDMLFVGQMDETEVGKLREGMPMELIIGAMNEQRFSAVLEYISPKGTESNGAMMFEIKGAAHIPDSVHIRAGYSANAEIVLNRRADVLTLAEAAIAFEGDKAYVEYITDTLTQASERREVEIGLSDGINIEIKSGLAEGDRIRGNAKAE